MPSNEEEQICERKPKNGKIYRFQHGCQWHGFIVKLMDNKKTDLKHLTGEEDFYGKKDPNLQYLSDPFRIPQFFIEYSLDKHKRWQLKEDTTRVTEIEMEPILTEDYSCYRIKRDRIFWNRGNLYWNDVSVAGSKRRTELQKYDEVLDRWMVYDGRKGKAKDERDETLDKTVTRKQLRLEKKASKNAIQVLPHVHTQYVLVEFTKSLSLHNNYRPSDYIYGFYSVNFPKRQAYLERRDAGMAGDIRRILSEVDDFDLDDHLDSEEDSELPENLGRKSVTLADFVTSNIRKEKNGKKREIRNGWEFVG